MKITTVGLDLAKSAFQVHAADERGQVVQRRKLRRDELMGYFAVLPPCLVGMEACGGAHYWARRIAGFGHEVRLMPPQYVKPYVKTNKSDARDAEAICEAVRRPNMRFVPVKSVEQQAVLSLHRARQGLLEARTSQSNQIRGLMAEFGLVLPRGVSQIRTRAVALLDASEDLPEVARQMFRSLLENFRDLDRRVQEFEKRILAWHRSSQESQRIEQIPGIGPLGATALIGSIADVKAFRSGRQLAAWLGLTPRQSSSGGKERLLGISKRGDTYLRTLLIHGARSVIWAEAHKTRAAPNSWIANMLQRKHPNIAAVALANKNARTLWALLAHGREFQPRYVSAPPLAA
jgi:Transposase and inactivated derivatives